MRHNPGKIFHLLPFILLLTACDSHRYLHDLENFVMETKQSTVKTAKMNLLKNMNEPKAVTYTSSALRSPFELEHGAGGPTSTAYNLHPLESYPISMLRYKGYAVEKGIPSAFILTPDDKVHSVTIGETIGDHYGKIVNIYPDRLEVNERVETPNAQGIMQISQRIVTLQRKEAADAEQK